MSLGIEPSHRGMEDQFRNETPLFMERGPRMLMNRGPSIIGRLPPPQFGNGSVPRGHNTNFGGSSFGMRDRSGQFSTRPSLGNFPPQQNQYSNNNMRGVRLNLLDRNRLGNPGDFNNRNNYGRW